jgi:hypothetical protein
MKVAILSFCLAMIFARSYCQKDNFDFYGNKIKCVNLTNTINDSLLHKKLVPNVIKNLIQTNVDRFGLEDWSLVLFLNQYVKAQFADLKEIDRVKILSVLLTYENLNNAIGIRNRSAAITLIGIEKNLIPTAYTFEESGYKFICIENDKKLFNLKEIQVVAGHSRDVSISAKSPLLNINDFAKRSCTFFNYSLRRMDTLSFIYSKQYISYSYDFPIVLSRKSYIQYPISIEFTNSLVQGLNNKIVNCRNKTDSINFLLRFVQTGVKNELNEINYGKNGFPSYPENTLVEGKGDCDDKVLLLAFLLSYYFRDVDIVFLYYPGHVRLGIPLEEVKSENRSFVEYKGKKYFIADPTDDFSIVGDVFYTILPHPLQIIR